MLIDTDNIERKILETLKEDPDIAACVKRFTTGTMTHSQFVFPYVDIVNLGCKEKELMAASGQVTMSFEIHAGIKNLAPEVAYKGNESGRKGIVELCNDIGRVVENNRFKGAFFGPTRNVKINPRFLYDKAETTFVGLVSFSGDVRFMF